MIEQEKKEHAKRREKRLGVEPPSEQKVVSATEPLEEVKEEDRPENELTENDSSIQPTT